MKDRLKPLYPHLIAVGIFLVLSVIFFLPAFQGMKLIQGDARNARGMSQEVRFFDQENDQKSAWTGSMFSGMPTYQISVYQGFDGNITSLIHTALFSVLPETATVWLLYAIGFYILMLSLRVRPTLAIVGAIAFAFSSYLIIIIEVGHMTKAMAVAYSPLMLAGMVWLYRGRFGLGTIFASLGAALCIGSNHPQVTYYFGILMILFGIAQLFVAIKEKKIKTFVIASTLMVISGIAGVLANFSNLYGTYEYGKYTTRGKSDLTIGADGKSNSANATSGLDKDYITQWSYGIDESWTLLVPNAKGGATGAIGADNKALQKADPQFRENIAQGGNHYWGEQSFTEGPVYVGAVICLLFILGMIFLDGALKWVMFAGALLALSLSWGKNFMGLTNFFLEYAPGYNKFRAVTIILVVLELCIPVVAIVFVNELINRREEWTRKTKTLLIGGGAVVGLLLAFWIMPASLFTFVSNTEMDSLNQQVAKQPEMSATIQAYVNSLKEVRMAIFKADVLRSLFFVLAAFALIYFYLKNGFKQTYLIAGLGLLILLDLFAVDKRYLNFEKVNGSYAQWEKPVDTEYPFIPTEGDKQIFQTEMSGMGKLTAAGTPEQLVPGKGAFNNPTEIAKEIEAKIARRSAELVKQKGMGELSEGEIATIQFGTLNLNSNYRVFNLNVSPFNDISTSYFHKSVGGYHGAKLKRYQELIEFYFGGSISQPVMNMLNVKYIETQQGVQQNPGACGNAWFVSNVKKVQNANEEILALKDFDPKSTAIIDVHQTDKAVAGPVDSSATIRQVSYAPNKLVYESESKTDQLAVFSEIYYQDWKVKIDGKPATDFRCDYVLRGLMIPAGKHTIEYINEPEMLATGRTGSWAGSALFAVAILGGIFAELRRSKKETEDEAA